MELTERAWQVITEARHEARRVGDEYVGTDHLLLAMLRDAQGAAAYVLTDLGIDYETVFARVSGEPAPIT